MTESLLTRFVTLWVVINPVAVVPVYMAVTATMNAAQRRTMAFQSVGYAAVILLFFLLAGQFVIEALGIGLLSFQIAGSAMLFLFAVSLIFGQSKPEEDIALARPGATAAVFPLATPAIAGPGSMLTVVLLTEHSRTDMAERAVMALFVLLVLLNVLLFLLAAGPIQRLIGLNGAAVISRIMGMILAAVAVDNIIRAILQLVASARAAV